MITGAHTAPPGRFLVVESVRRAEPIPGFEHPRIHWDETPVANFAHYELARDLANKLSVHPVSRGGVYDDRARLVHVGEWPPTHRRFRKATFVTAVIGLSGNGEQAHRRFKKPRPKPKSLLNPAHRRRKS